jgi:hypothetical protein
MLPQFERFAILFSVLLVITESVTSNTRALWPVAFLSQTGAVAALLEALNLLLALPV